MVYVRRNQLQLAVRVYKIWSMNKDNNVVFLSHWEQKLEEEHLFGLSPNVIVFLSNVQLLEPTIVKTFKDFLK